MIKKMETQEILNKKVGNVEKPKSTVAPKVVKIMAWVIKDKTASGEKMKTPLAQAMVKHPDKDELLVLSKVKQFDGEKTFVTSFWVNLDEDGNFYKSSAIDIVLKKLGCETLEETVGKEIDTVEESKTSPYLCLKVY